MDHHCTHRPSITQAPTRSHALVVTRVRRQLQSAPGFSETALSEALAAAGIAYRHNPCAIRSRTRPGSLAQLPSFLMLARSSPSGSADRMRTEAIDSLAMLARRERAAVP